MARKRDDPFADQPKREEVPCHTEGCTRPARMRSSRYSPDGELWHLCFTCADRLHSEHLAKWREELNSSIKDIGKGPGRTAIEHWRANLKRFPEGHIGHDYARQALARLDPQDEREPGQEG